jgi:hypothetical protein
MPPDQPHPRTHLFTIRIWIEPLGCDQDEVRMSVTHVLSEETHYFRTWLGVMDFLLAKLKAMPESAVEEGGER